MLVDTRCAAASRDTIGGVTTILVPDPSLVLLVGAAGAGKTTFAARHFAADEVLSSDAYRALVSGDEANQAVSHVAFRILHRELERRLAKGLLTVVDATNITRHNRRQLIGRARSAGTPVAAIVLALPEDVVLARNAERARRVDEDVVRDQLERVAATARDGVLTGEGCAAVCVLRTPEAVDAVVVGRLPVAGPPRFSPNPPPRPR
jgi:predicted kinase